MSYWDAIEELVKLNSGTTVTGQRFLGKPLRQSYYEAGRETG